MQKKPQFNVAKLPTSSHTIKFVLFTQEILKGMLNLEGALPIKAL